MEARAREFWAFHQRCLPAKGGCEQLMHSECAVIVDLQSQPQIFLALGPCLLTTTIEMNRSTALFLSLRRNQGASIQTLISGPSAPGPCSFPYELTRSWASQTPSQPQSDASIVKEATGSTQAEAAPKQPAESWTEVVHESGKTYFWNQQTGETTELGAPKPADDNGRDSGTHGGSGQGTESASDRTESPLPDRTGFYAATGAVVGAVLGWGSQFF